MAAVLANNNRITRLGALAFKLVHNTHALHNIAQTANTWLTCKVSTSSKLLDFCTSYHKLAVFTLDTPCKGFGIRIKPNNRQAAIFFFLLLYLFAGCSHKLLHFAQQFGNTNMR